MIFYDFFMAGLARALYPPTTKKKKYAGGNNARAISARF
jgi:hypothetical protein